MRTVITMHSEEYGDESFSYDCLEDGLAGLRRLAIASLERGDDVVRSFVITEEHEYGGEWPPSDEETK